MRDWTFSRERFEDAWRGRPAARYRMRARARATVRRGHGADPGRSVTGDEFGTVPAVERLLAYFTRSAGLHFRISTRSIAEPASGHFAFFDSRLEEKLCGCRWSGSGPGGSARAGLES